MLKPPTRSHEISRHLEDLTYRLIVHGDTCHSKSNTNLLNKRDIHDTDIAPSETKKKLISHDKTVMEHKSILIV